MALRSLRDAARKGKPENYIRRDNRAYRAKLATVTCAKARLIEAISISTHRCACALGTEFAALLTRANVSQAAFARTSGYTTRQVNNWCRGRAAVPPWAAVLAILVQDASPEAIQILLEEAQFSWHETLGVPPNADAGTVRRAMARLALAHHPDKGGTQEQMARITMPPTTEPGRP
jgi:DNA-binding transcriptional regulator YiaG